MLPLRPLIIGQGLAGTALGLELETAGVDFVVADPGSDSSASCVAAGLINPITGQRWAKTWQIDTLLPLAAATFARWEQRLGLPLWRNLTLRRRFHDDTERKFVRERVCAGRLLPYAKIFDESANELVPPGAQVRLPAFLLAATQRWRAQGRMRECAVRDGDLHFFSDHVMWRHEKFSSVILATGASPLTVHFFGNARLVPAKGEIITIRTQQPVFNENEALLAGHWLVPESANMARVGATYERGAADVLTNSIPAELIDSARHLSGCPNVTVTSHEAGVRLTTPDRLPVAGWHPENKRLGLCLGLGSKGTLFAPWLAQHWVRHLTLGEPFPREVSPARLFSASV